MSELKTENVPVEPLTEAELAEFADYCNRPFLHFSTSALHNFLIRSVFWRRDCPPRADITDRNNLPFYLGLYPELSEGDKVNHRVLLRHDGEAWLTLREFVLNSTYEDQGDDYHRYMDGLSEELQEKINGQPVRSDEREVVEGCLPVVRQRIEGGMSRRLRIISNTATVYFANTFPDGEERIEDFADGIQPFLQLSDAERATADELFRTSS